MAGIRRPISEEEKELVSGSVTNVCVSSVGKMTMTELLTQGIVLLLYTRVTVTQTIIIIYG